MNIDVMAAVTRNKETGALVLTGMSDGKTVMLSIPQEVAEVLLLALLAQHPEQRIPVAPRSLQTLHHDKSKPEYLGLGIGRGWEIQLRFRKEHAPLLRALADSLG